MANDIAPNGETVIGVVAGVAGNASGSVGVTVTGLYGTVVIHTDGTYSYTLDNTNSAVQALRVSSDHLTDLFTYTLEDSLGYQSTTQLTISIDGRNDAPIAVDDSGVAVEAGGVSNATSGNNASGNVLANDTDVDSGDTKSVTGVTSGSQSSASGNVGASLAGTYGSIVINSDGSYTYTIDNSSLAVQALRNSSQTLSEVFTYAMEDTAGLSSLARVTITIQGANDAPLSVTDNNVAVEAGGSSNSVAGLNPSGNVLSNDTDVDAGDTQTVTGVVAGSSFNASGNIGTSVSGSYGSITINADGSYNYVVDNSNSAVQALRTSGNTLQDVFTYTMSDAGGLTSTTQITITIQGANDAPVPMGDTADATEAGGYSNSTSGNNPTGNVLSNDSDVDAGDSLSVSGVANGIQSSASGNVGTVVAGLYGSINIASNGSYTYTVDNSLAAVQALLNYGDTLTDTFTYTVMDLAGATTTTQLVVTIHGQNDGPAAVSDNDTAVEAGGYANDVAGTNSSGNVLTNDTDWDSTSLGETKSVVGVAAGILANASGSVGNVVTGTYGNIVLNADGSYSYVVDNTNSAVQALRTSANTLQDVFTYTFSDAGGLTSSSQITITIQGANDAPVGVNDSAVAIEAGGYANATGGSQGTGNVLTNDIDVDSISNGETRSVSGVVAGGQSAANGNVGVSVNGTYGSITINANGSYTYVINNNHPTVQALRTASDSIVDTFTYQVVDAAGLSSVATLTVTITGNNDAPTDLTSSPLSIDENAPNSTSVGTLLTTDIDSGDSFTYQLTNDANGRFTINSATGEIMVADGTQLDRETNAFHLITVQVTDAGGLNFSKSFTIQVNDVNESNASTPIDTQMIVNTVVENAPNGTTVGITAFATDDDATTNSITYSLDDDAFGRFAIDSVTGVVTVADGSLLDYETQSSYTIVVRATSADTSFATQSFSVNLIDVNEGGISAVVDSNAATNLVLENSSVGTIVGITALATDPDGTDIVTYSLDDNAGGRFTIDSATGAVTVNGLIDREDSVSYSIVVRATSSDSSFSTQQFTILVSDVNEYPVGPLSDTDNSLNLVTENSAVGTLLGITAFAQDPDATAQVFYSLDNDAGGRFSIDAVSGVVSTNTLLDFEQASSHNIVVRATSSDGSWITRLFTVTVVDASEAPVAFNDTYTTNSATVLSIGGSGVLTNDIDPDGGTLSVILVSAPSDGTLTLAADGTFQYIPVAAVGGTFTFEYKLSDGVLESNVAVVTIQVSAVLPPPPPPPPTPTPSDSGSGTTDTQNSNSGDSTSDSSTGSSNDAGTSSPSDASPELNPTSTILAAEEENGVQVQAEEAASNGILPGQFLGFLEEPGDSVGVRSTIRLTSVSSGEPFSANTTRVIRSLTEDVFQGRESFAGRDYLWTKLDDFHQKLESDVTVSSYSVGTVAVSS